MNKRTLLRVLPTVRDAVRATIHGYGEGRTGAEAKYARGLSGEGYAGGYLDALNDVEAMLTHGYPNDKWGFWRKAVQREVEK